MEKAYLEIAKKKIEIEKLRREIQQLAPQAVQELKNEGLSYDKIALILNIGKATALKIVNEGYKPERTVCLSRNGRPPKFLKRRENEGGKRGDER